MIRPNLLTFFFLVAFLLRLILLPAPGFSVDTSAWQAWAQRLGTLGPTNFYSDTVWTHYTPGYLYVLWLVQKLGLNSLAWLKLPALIADLATAGLIFLIVKKHSQKWAFLATSLYLFNPALIFNSMIWGQADSFLTLTILTAFYFIFEKRLIPASILVAFSFLVKPQALFAFLVLTVAAFKNFERHKFILFILAIPFLSLLLAWPFFPDKPFTGLVSLVWRMGQDYPYTTLNSFGFWQLFGNFLPDDKGFITSSKNWGIIIFFLIQGLIFIKLKREKFTKRSLYFGAGLSLLAFFFFLTRVHERYMLPALPFILLSAALYRSRLILISYFLLTFFHLVNLYYVYGIYEDNFLVSPFFLEMIRGNIFTLSLFSLIVYFILFFDKLSSMLENMLKPKIFLVLILCFAFFSRIINLTYPAAYVFDEVYHAFTAQEMVKGNPAAWEWWNTPPAGFAYEWTHPPVAKLIMAGGIYVGRALGFSDFLAWRFPAALAGTAVVFLVYKLALLVFARRKIAILSAAIFSLDGLGLVMSRIGMADIYLILFLLLTLLAALQKRWFLSGIFWGLAIATKWTASYLVFPMFFLFLAQFLRKKSYLHWMLFLAIPVGLYLFSYLFFFTSGHNFDQFIQLQGQMWGYHTGLKATHGYQSTPLSWPLDLRPVWFYVNYQPQAVGNIYALGNPLIFWFGLVSLPFFIWQVLLRKKPLFAWLAICYFIFWLPWIFSPRIMFLYHYLPSVPFLAMILAWFLAYLDKIFNSQFSLFFLLVFFATFCFFYPLWTGILIPKDLVGWFFWLPSWK